MKMKKDVLAGMVLDYNKRSDSTFSAINDEPKELKTNFRKLKSDLAITRNVNDKLTQQLILLERKCWAYKQYSLFVITSGLLLKIFSQVTFTVLHISFVNIEGYFNWQKLSNVTFSPFFFLSFILLL